MNRYLWGRNCEELGKEKLLPNVPSRSKSPLTIVIFKDLVPDLILLASSFAIFAGETKKNSVFEQTGRPLTSIKRYGYQNLLDL